MTRSKLLAGAIVACCTLPAGSQAATFFASAGSTLTGSCDGSVPTDTQTDGSTANYQATDAACQAFAFGVPIAGGVGVLADSTMMRDPSNSLSSNIFGTRGSALASFSSSVPTMTDPLPMSVNFEVHGSLFAQVNDNTRRFSESASARLSGRVALSYCTSQFNCPTTFKEFTETVTASDIAGGQLTAQKTISRTITTDTVMIDPSFGIRIEMSLTATANAGGSRQTVGQAFVEASNSLTFAKSGPVFNLPDGVTISIPEANIFDNRWIDPRVPPPDVVPLPASAAMLAGGLFGLGLLRRRRVRV